jgi:hypothetical protein
LEVSTVLQKTLRKSLWLGVALTVLCSAVWSKIPAIEEPQVTVSVHNDARIPLAILLQAESEATRIFRQSGLEIQWLNCSIPLAVPENPVECATADFPRHLQLRIVRRSLNLDERAMGIAYLSDDGTGCYADLFFDRAQLIHEISHVSVAALLGHGVAHEIGHLLLGTNSHAPAGIMRASWQPADLADASQGRLLFSTLQSQEMRNKFSAWHSQERKVGSGSVSGQRVRRADYFRVRQHAPAIGSKLRIELPTSQSWTCGQWQELHWSDRIGPVQ